MHVIAVTDNSRFTQNHRRLLSRRLSSEACNYSCSYSYCGHHIIIHFTVKQPCFHLKRLHNSSCSLNEQTMTTSRTDSPSCIQHIFEFSCIWGPEISEGESFQTHATSFSQACFVAQKGKKMGSLRSAWPNSFRRLRIFRIT